jgi:S-formylglutathione hydrolase FrmB
MTHRTFCGGLLALAVFGLNIAPASAQCRLAHRQCTGLAGTLVDYTQNGRCDQRVYSSALCECRDLYVYLPPGYDPKGSYPLVIWLHSYTTDEREFAEHVAPVIDRAIVAGELPPVVVAAPDGSLHGDHHFVALGSWFVNSPRGRFEDYIVDDVLGFMEKNYAVCRDRSGRALAGFSMGGHAAFNLGMKHRDTFKVVAGISPALNLRYSGCDCRYLTDFDPSCDYVRDDYNPHEVVGRFYCGTVKVRAWELLGPVFGHRCDAPARLSQENPLEHLARLPIRPGDLDMYIAYGKRDEMNIDAQVESFLHEAAKHGIQPTVTAAPCGVHSIPYMVSELPGLCAWLKSHLQCPK